MHLQGNLNDRLTGGGRSVCRAWLPVLAGLLLLVPLPAPARDEHGAIQLIAADVHHGESEWLLNAWLDIKLSSTAREALENGVRLVFVFQIQVLEKHAWWWDRVVEEHTEVRKIRYHPLSQTYIVKNDNTGALRGFRRLSEAMHSLGMLPDISIINDRAMEDTGFYTVRLRGRLDIESLPTPIRLLAYVSPAWNIKSDWYQWPLGR